MDSILEQHEEIALKFFAPLGLRRLRLARRVSRAFMWLCDTLLERIARPAIGGTEFDGWTQSPPDVFNLRSMKWTTIPLSGPGTNFKEDGSAMVGLQDGRLVIGGGYSQPYHDGGEDTSIHCNEEAMSDVAVYSPTNKTWLSLPDLQKGRAAFILLCCEGGRLVALGGSDHYRCYYPAGDDITENLGALDLLTVEALEPGASSWSMLPNAPFPAGAAGDLPGVGLVIVQHDHDSTPGQKRAAWYDWDERVWQELPALPAECQYIESGWVESGRFVVQGPAGPTPEQEAQAAAAGPQFATEQARGSIMCAPDFFSHRFFALDANCRTWEQTHQWDFPIEDVGNSMCKLMVFPVPGGCIALCRRNENYWPATSELWEFETGRMFAFPWIGGKGPRGIWWSGQRQVGGDKGEWPYSTLLPHCTAASY
jgi:hypothetical protein